MTLTPLEERSAATKRTRARFYRARSLLLEGKSSEEVVAILDREIPGANRASERSTAKAARWLAQRGGTYRPAAAPIPPERRLEAARLRKRKHRERERERIRRARALLALGQSPEAVASVLVAEGASEAQAQRALAYIATHGVEPMPQRAPRRAAEFPRGNAEPAPRPTPPVAPDDWSDLPPLRPRANALRVAEQTEYRDAIDGLLVLVEAAMTLVSGEVIAGYWSTGAPLDDLAVLYVLDGEPRVVPYDDVLDFRQGYIHVLSVPGKAKAKPIATRKVQPPSTGRAPTTRRRVRPQIMGGGPTALPPRPPSPASFDLSTG